MNSELKIFPTGSMMSGMRRTGAAALTVLVVLALAVAGTQQRAKALDNGVARTPPMGWNSWVPFGQAINQNLMERQARALVSSGLKAAGYKYFVVDGGWQAQRDAAGNLQADPQKFPSGIKALADYVHHLGLKFGLHLAVGVTDCAHTEPGTQSAPGGAQQDADQLAAWGVDYLKFDGCNIQYPPGSDAAQQAAFKWGLFVQMRDALARTGRPIVYSTNGVALAGPDGTPWDEIANMRRIGGDIKPCFDCAQQPNKLNVIQELGKDAGLAATAGPGHWQDPDTLVIGVRTQVVNGVPTANAFPGLTDTEARAQLSLWAILASPLIMSNDLTTMTAQQRRIVTNRAVIAVDQDPLGMKGTPVVDGTNGVWVLAKPLANGDRAVVLFNSNDTPETISTTAQQAGFTSPPPAPGAHPQEYLLANLWSGNHRQTTGTIAAAVPAHGVVMYRIRQLGPSA